MDLGLVCLDTVIWLGCDVNCSEDSRNQAFVSCINFEQVIHETRREAWFLKSKPREAGECIPQDWWLPVKHPLPKNSCHSFSLFFTPDQNNGRCKQLDWFDGLFWLSMLQLTIAFQSQLASRRFIFVRHYMTQSSMKQLPFFMLLVSLVFDPLHESTAQLLVLQVLYLACNHR